MSLGSNGRYSWSSNLTKGAISPPGNSKYGTDGVKSISDGGGQMGESSRKAWGRFTQIGESKLILTWSDVEGAGVKPGGSPAGGPPGPTF